jgi:hypothetical protein
MACFLTVLSLGVCKAGTLPAAVYKVSIAGSSSVPITYESDFQRPPDGQSSLRLSTAGGGKPQADVQIHAKNIFFSFEAPVGYDARVTYYFCINERAEPPTRVPFVPVQVSVAGSARVLGNGRLRALAAVNVVGFGVSERIAEARLGVAGLSDVPYAEFSEIISGAVPVGEAYRIVLRAQGSVGIGSQPSLNHVGDIQAVADPAVVIDPNFEFRDFYEIQFSSNLEVPEPSTFALAALVLARLASARQYQHRRFGLRAGINRVHHV